MSKKGNALGTKDRRSWKYGTLGRGQIQSEKVGKKQATQRNPERGKKREIKISSKKKWGMEEKIFRVYLVTPSEKGRKRQRRKKGKKEKKKVTGGKRLVGGEKSFNEEENRQKNIR